MLRARVADGAGRGWERRSLPMARGASGGGRGWEQRAGPTVLPPLSGPSPSAPASPMMLNILH